MKILVIPDIHGRKFWREAIQNNMGKVDKIVFLGDYLDPYTMELHDYPETMETPDFDGTYLGMLNDIVGLKKSEPDKFILLTGNHTDSYIWDGFSSATRTDHKNWEKYHNFFLDNLIFFNLVFVQNNVIFSHAGITKDWAEKVWDLLEFPENELVSIKEVAQTLQDTPLLSFDLHYINLISDISYHRGGYGLTGSCEWADIMEHIDHYQSEVQGKVIPQGEDGIYQVFGHTQILKPLINEKWACLDCRKAFIIDTNTFEIYGSEDSL